MNIRAAGRQIAATCWKRLPAAFLFVAVVALVVRVTVRDRVPIVSVLFYATPYFLVAIMLFLSALRYLFRRSWGIGSLCLVMSIVCGIACHFTTFARNVPPNVSPGANVVFWNAGRGIFGWQSIADSLREFDADMIGLVEAGQGDPLMAQFWRTNFPDHNVVGPQQGMVFFARGKVTSHEFGLLGEGGKYARFEVQRDGRAVNVLLVDIKSNPFRSRREAFEHLVDLVDMYAGKPLMLMGDFNTPVDSVFMSGLESRLHHAFHTYGTGYDSTWPVPIPLLSLDHVWVSPDLPLHSCRLPWTWRSDHKPVLTILESAK